MKSVSVEPDALDSEADVEMSDALREAVETEIEYLDSRGVERVRMRCRENSNEVYQATIQAGDEMYRLSEVSPGNVSRTVFRNPERRGDENLVGAPSEHEEDEVRDEEAVDEAEEEDEETADAGDDGEAEADDEVDAETGDADEAQETEEAETDEGDDEASTEEEDEDDANGNSSGDEDQDSEDTSEDDEK